MNFRESAEKMEDYIIERRRYYHQHPELSLEEYETTESLTKDLQDMGIEVQRFEGKNGLVAYIRGGKPGKTVMLRSDIDALPVHEDTGLPFASINEGKMHACGHDSHMSILLGAAKLLNEVKDQIPGTVKLFFQPAEEVAQGALQLINDGMLENVSACFGMHVWGAYDAPKIILHKGNAMASADTFTLTIEGVSAHASAPNLGVDAIVAAASVIMNVQTFVSRNNDPLNPLVVTIGTIEGGQRFNIIANKVVMTGTVRTFSKELRSHLEEDLTRIIKGTAEALGCTATLQYDQLCSAVINEDEEVYKIAHDAAVKLYGEEGLGSAPGMMGSEDFAYYMDHIPGLYGFIGSRNEDLGYVYTNHHEKYTVDENILKRGAAMYAQFAFDYLTEKANQ